MIPVLYAAVAAVCFAPASSTLASHTTPLAPPTAEAGRGAIGRAPDAIPDSAYQRLFDEGRTMSEFLDAAKARKEQWAANYARGVVADAVLTRARSAPGPWKLLVVAVDGCSDSVNTVPYIARLAEQMMGVELRIIDSNVGRAVMDAHRTPDGRGATPTVVLLDANYQERGCWVERPAELRDWMIDNKGKVKDNELFEHKMAWYDEDVGAKTLLDIATMFESAGKGDVKC
ncbi:MAG: thioredoxin family protein [Gemmatimonadota bacterium]